MKRWRLCLDEGNGNGRFVTIGFEPTFIGRAPDCILQLNHPLVSRRHCMINSDGERLFVRDAGSKHGTYVNGHRADRDIELHSGDTLWVGVYPITVESLVIEHRADTTQGLRSRTSPAPNPAWSIACRTADSLNAAGSVAESVTMPVFGFVVPDRG